MSLRKRGRVWVADLRGTGGDQRLSLHTSDKDTARVLHQELERMLARGEQVTKHTIKALLSARGVLQRATSGIPGMALPAATSPVPEARPAGTVSLREAFHLVRQRRDDWRNAKAGHTLEANYNHVASHFGHERPLASITSGDTATWRSKMVEQGLSASTINQRTSLLSVLFTEVIDMYHETGEQRYAMVKPRLKRAKVAAPRFRILTATEEATVLAWFRDHGMPMMADLTGALLDTGFRLSEMLQVDPSAQSRYIDANAGMIWARDTKSGHDRCVPMTGRVQDIFRRHPEGFKGLAVDRADHLWARMRSSIGLGHDKQFVIHALRHTCCTRMVVAGFDAFRVMTWMGHRNVMTTQRYVSLFGGNLADLRSAHESVPVAKETTKEVA